MYISETYLDSSLPNDDSSRLNIPRYNMVRAENPTNTTRISVCAYLKVSHYLFSSMLLFKGILIVGGSYSKLKICGFIIQIT